MRHARIRLYVLLHSMGKSETYKETIKGKFHHIPPHLTVHSAIRYVLRATRRGATSSNVPLLKRAAAAAAAGVASHDTSSHRRCSTATYMASYCRQRGVSLWEYRYEYSYSRSTEDEILQLRDQLVTPTRTGLSYRRYGTVPCVMLSQFRGTKFRWTSMWTPWNGGRRQAHHKSFPRMSFVARQIRLRSGLFQGLL